MIRRSNEKTVEVKKMFDGDGEAIFHKILNGQDELYGKGRVFSHVVLKTGCEIGWHVHQNEGEAYYVLKGVGSYNDDGSMVTVYPGDVTFTDSGQGHSIKNECQEDLELIALVLFK